MAEIVCIFFNTWFHLSKFVTMILNILSIFAGKVSQVEGYNVYNSKTEIPDILLRSLAPFLSAL